MSSAGKLRSKKEAPAKEGSAARERICRWLWPLAVVLTVFIASGNAIEAPFVPKILFAPDKIAHLAVFGLIATLLYRALPAHLSANRRSLIAIASIALFGLFDEIRQSFTPARTFDWYDFVADAVGALIATLCYRWLTPYQQLLEWRPFARMAAAIRKRPPSRP